MHIHRTFALLAAAGFAGLITPAAAGQDWDTLPVFEVELFQPGQASWEWLLIPGDHGPNGARRMREGRPCMSCHQDEEGVIGNSAMSGEAFEPDPLAGMPGSLSLAVQAAVVEDRLHVRLAWQAVEGKPHGDSSHAARVTMLIADDGLPAARATTCWASCHSDLPEMSADSGAELTKYLPNSRTSMSRTGGGDSIKDPAELQKELDGGAFLEFWSALLAADGSAEARDGYILEARNTHTVPGMEADARREDGRWIVDIIRPLVPSNGPRKTLATGNTYPVSFAVHESHTEHRRHYVSFPLALRIGTDADGMAITIEDIIE